MEIFRSLHLQKNLGQVQDAARREPVLFLNHGQPSAVMMSVTEFKRLKIAAGEPVPKEVEIRKPVIRAGLPPDPLGYDVSDLAASALAMAADFDRRRNRAEIQNEIDRAERRFGIAQP